MKLKKSRIRQLEASLSLRHREANELNRRIDNLVTILNDHSNSIDRLITLAADHEEQLNAMRDNGDNREEP